VDELGIRRELDGPPGRAHAVAEIDLLAEHEEGRVETSDLVDRFAAEQQDRAREELGRAVGAVVEAGAVEVVQEPRARRELAEEEVLRGEAPEGGEAAHGFLHPPVRADQTRAGDADAGICLGERAETLDPVVPRPGVRVEQEVPTPRRRLHADVVRRPEADVLRELDHLCRRDMFTDQVRGPVRRGVVHNDHLMRDGGERVETRSQVPPRVVRHNDDGEIHA
jgi:hypothetical protein